MQKPESYGFHGDVCDDPEEERERKDNIERAEASRRLYAFDPPKVGTAPLKRRRMSENSTSTKIKGKGSSLGKLAQLLNIPLDVFFEIISQLRPIDVLQLSRVSKHFRSTFASRSSRHIWIAARKNMPGMPECPFDMSELQYASLVFEHICQACGKSRAHKVDFSLRVRFCGPCYKENVQTGRTIMSHWNSPMDEILTLLPRSVGERNQFSSNHFDPNNNHRYHYFYVPEVDMVAKRYKELSSDSSKQNLFQEQQQEIASRIMNHAAMLNKWAQSRRYEKLDGDLERSRNRETSIISKFRELGYDEDVINSQLYDERWLTLARQPRELTPRIWQNIRPKLEVLVAEATAKAAEERRDLRKAEFGPVWENFVLENPSEDDRNLMPRHLNASELYSVRGMLAEDEWRIPPSRERLLAIKDPLVADIEDYKRKIQIGLIKVLTNPPVADKHSTEYIQPNSQDEHVDVGLLQRAHTFFQCTCDWNCKTVLPYPQIFSHSHIQTSRSFTPWTLNSMRPPPEIKETAILLLRKLGFPEDTSHVTMSDLGERLMCLCGCPTQMNFVALVQHFMEESAMFHQSAQRRLIFGDTSENSCVTDNQHGLSHLTGERACIAYISCEYPFSYTLL